MVSKGLLPVLETLKAGRRSRSLLHFSVLDRLLETITERFRDPFVRAIGTLYTRFTVCCRPGYAFPRFLQRRLPRTVPRLFISGDSDA